MTLTLDLALPPGVHPKEVVIVPISVNGDGTRMAVLWPDPEETEGPMAGWWVADIPSLPVASQGANREEALANLHEALELYLEVSAEQGHVIAPPDWE